MLFTHIYTYTCIFRSFSRFAWKLQWLLGCFLWILTEKHNPASRRMRKLPTQAYGTAPVSLVGLGRKSPLLRRSRATSSEVLLRSQTQTALLELHSRRPVSIETRCASHSKDTASSSKDLTDLGSQNGFGIAMRRSWFLIRSSIILFL